MADRKSSRRFLSLQVALHVLLVFVQGAEDAEEAYRSRRSLVLENFLPINIPAEAPRGREKRDVEGSGEEEGPVFSEINEKSVDDADNSTITVPRTNLIDTEGSGEESASEEGKDDGSSVPIIADAEDWTTTTTTEPETESSSEEYDASTTSEETSTEEESATKEMIFDKSEDFTDEVSGETTTMGGVTTEVETTPTEPTTVGFEEDTAAPTTLVHEPTFFKEDTTVESQTAEVETTTTEVASTTVVEIPTIPIAVPEATESTPGSETERPTTTQVAIEDTEAPKETSEKISPETTPTSTQGAPVILGPAPTSPAPVVEEIFKEAKTPLRSLEALPGNILRKENLSLGADPMLIVTNTRVMDSEEGEGSAEPKRLGAYIVIGLILLSFSSLVGYITFKKRLSRKRLDFESSPESNDTEKALLSLSDYKDNSELEENHLKNNEITPIVVKSNTQINRFEKNTNFSSPKNLNTTANEKNIEKDNVLKSTAENLTQVIIEDSPKEVEEDKNAPSMEKLIVRTRVDQDSIPKKPIIVTRTSGGYMPIPQDNSSIS